MKFVMPGRHFNAAKVDLGEMVLSRFFCSAGDQRLHQRMRLKSLLGRYHRLRALGVTVGDDFHGSPLCAVDIGRYKNGALRHKAQAMGVDRAIVIAACKMQAAVEIVEPQ